MIRQRAYFFDTPQTTAGDKLRSNNIPSEATFRDIMDSVAMKAEAGDYATETVQGLVKLSTVSVSKARSGAGVVLPAHLPVLTYGGSNTELITPGTESYQGIKLTAIGGTYRLDYQVDFDPTSITAKATPTVNDYMVIVDVADSNKPKKALFSAMPGGGVIWKDTATVISPLTSGDSLDMLTASVNASGYTLSNAAATYINPLPYPSHVGANLHLTAGVGQHASTPYAGGNLYAYGNAGINGAASGNIYLGYDGSQVRGLVGVGGATQAGYTLAVTGNVYLNGKAYLVPRAIGSDAGATVSSAIIYGNNGVLYTHTFKDFMTSILGGTAPTGDSVLLYSGSAYTSILIGVVKDAFMHTNASTGDLEMAVLDMDDRVNTASIKATGLAPSTIIGATGTDDVVGVFDKTTGQLKLGTYKSADLGVAKVTDFAKVTVTTDYSGIPTQLPSNIVGDSTAGEVDLTMPSGNSVPDGTQVEVIQWSANVVKIIATLRTGPATTVANYSLGGDQKGVMIYSDFANNEWIIGRYF